MAASAEYELEKRVERLDLFPVELEKGGSHPFPVLRGSPGTLGTEPEATPLAPAVLLLSHWDMDLCVPQMLRGWESASSAWARGPTWAWRSWASSSRR